MSVADICAALMFLGVVAYAILAGADFGSGVWDLLAGNAERGGAIRHQVDASIGPVWEANHVWLIYVLVFMWTAFPRAFAAMITTLFVPWLFVPWLFVGLGIVLRGAGFAFRKFAETLGQARFYGAAFAPSQVDGSHCNVATSGPAGPAPPRGWAACSPCSPARSSRRRSSPLMLTEPVTTSWPSTAGVVRSSQASHPAASR